MSHENKPKTETLAFEDILDMARELDSPELREAYAKALKEDGGSKKIDELYEEIKELFKG